jgi:hypothetical protein
MPDIGAEHGNAYACFVALGAYQDLQRELPEPLRMVQCLKLLETPDGAWANAAGLKTGSTNATAAAVTLLHQLGMPINSNVGDWLSHARIRKAASSQCRKHPSPIYSRPPRRYTRLPVSNANSPRRFANVASISSTRFGMPKAVFTVTGPTIISTRNTLSTACWRWDISHSLHPPPEVSSQDSVPKFPDESAVTCC